MSYKQTAEHIDKRKRFGADNANWRGGRMHHMGYVSIRVYPDDFFYPMASWNGYVREHRLVMAKHLGRNLSSWELIHHINGTKDDNRLENLQIVTDDEHKQITVLENKIKFLEKRVMELEGGVKHGYTR